MIKKAASAIVCVFLLFSTACSSSEASDGGQGDKSPVSGAVSNAGSASNTPAAEITVEEQVLLDKDGLKITLKSMADDEIWGPSLKLLVENSMEKSVGVQIRNLAINGLMMDSMFSAEVAPGKKSNEEITLVMNDLETASVTTIKDIEFNFTVFDAGSWNTIFDSETIHIKTSADEAFVQTYDDSGFTAFDKDGFKVVIKKLVSEDSFWGADIYVYIENNSPKNATIQIREMSVNGYMLEPIFSSDVLSGKKAFDTITFLEQDLTDNDIKEIESLEFKFHIFNMDGWDTLLDSETITVSFN